MDILTVVIPTYNRAGTISRAINSVLRQNVCGLEVIIVDDGSTDDTESVIKSFSDERIVYIRQGNGGGSKARNTGILAAKGFYIAFLDSDDEYLPFHLEQSLNILKSEQVGCVYSQIIVDRGDGITFVKPPRSIKADEEVSEYLLSDRGFIQTSTIVTKTDFARKTLFDEKLKYGQDTDFAIRLFANGAKFKMAPKPSVLWSDEWSDKRISSRIDYENRLEWLARIRHLLTDKAYYADLGWPVAKGLSQAGFKARAVRYFFNAVVRRCYNIKLMITILLQVILSPKAYRKFSDFFAKNGARP